MIFCLSCVVFQDPAAFFRKNEDFLGGAGGRDRRRGSSRDRRPSPGLSYVGETYGLSQNFLESLGLKLPLVNRVFITNVNIAMLKSINLNFLCLDRLWMWSWQALRCFCHGRSRHLVRPSNG